MKNNNTTMETQIIEQGNFSIEYYSAYDICFLFYKNNPFWGGKFNELIYPKVIKYVFDRESDREKAESFISELYKWYLSHHWTFEELLDEYKTIK